MHRLYQRQLAKATGPDGGVDLDVLGNLVVAAYEEADQDRERTDRSISLMVGEIEAAHRRLVDAFDIIPEAIALFDAEDRHVMWNQPYGELCKNIAPLSRGVTFEAVLRAGLAKGHYAEAIGREEEWLAERLRKHREPSSTVEQHLEGDRWLRIEERRTADGGSVGIRVDITELKRREASFRLLFESNPVPMFVCHAKTLRLLAVNDAAVNHYGYSSEQLLDMSVYNLRHPHDREQARELAESGEGDYQTGQVRRHVKADGTHIKVQIYSKPFSYHDQPATFFAAIDVTEQLRAEAQLRIQKATIDAAISNMSQGLAMFNREARLTLCNDRFIDMYGFSRGVVEPGCTLQTLLAHARDLNALDGDPFELSSKLLHAVRDGKPWTRTDELADGRTIYVNTRPTKDGGWISTHEDISEQRRARERIEYLAHHDELTGLPNRAVFNAHLESTIANAAKSGLPFALLCIDFDKFQEVNDVFGQRVGDGALRELGARLRGVSADAFVARLGGDEFAIVAADGDQPATAEDLAASLLTTAEEPISVDGHDLRIGLSLGIAIYPGDGTNAVTLQANANAALYRAKREGRGAFRFFEREMDQSLRTRRALQQELRSALAHDQLILHYQPQARTEGTIVGFEALARWNHPRSGFIPPSTFIPLAEESGLIMQLGERALRQACQEAATWAKPLRVSVNLSPVQFYHGDIAALVHTVLLQTGLAPRRLELEITESVLVSDFDRAASILRRLKALGVGIAMDDFGTGYSSLSYLHRFPFDRLKIDRSFVMNLGQNKPAGAIVRAVINLAKALSLPVTAEGVETAQQLEFLAHESCDEVQGYLLGRPAPIEVYGDKVGWGTGRTATA